MLTHADVVRCFVMTHVTMHSKTLFTKPIEIKRTLISAFTVWTIIVVVTFSDLTFLSKQSLFLYLLKNFIRLFLTEENSIHDSETDHLYQFQEISLGTLI